MIKLRKEPERIEKEGNFSRRLGTEVLRRQSSSDGDISRRRFERAWERKVESVKTKITEFEGYTTIKVEMEVGVSEIMRNTANSTTTQHCTASSSFLDLPG